MHEVVQLAGLNHWVDAMREWFEEVCTLQLEHSSENTPAMARRGDLIRNVIPAEMRTWPATSSAAVLPFKGRLNVQGRDGTGLKTFVPWVRIHSPELSPSAQKGWYVVYLFRQDGSGVSICISHGSTRFDGGDFKPRSQAEASALMEWARGMFSSEAGAIGLEQGVDLKSSEKLSKAYESTTAFSKFYPVDDLPSEAKFMQDALNAVALLGQIYRALELGKEPDAEPPEISAVKAAIEGAARPTSAQSSSGQGFGLTGPERKLVEDHAMAMAEAWLLAQGYTNIRDVHSSHSCDFMAMYEGTEHFIEVKGTTAGLGKVLLTANEVELHRREHPHNVLIVVYDINLLETRSKADGGKMEVYEQWDIEGVQLKALSYVCQL